MAGDAKIKGRAAELIVAYRFLMYGMNVYLPAQSGKRDLIVELWKGKFFGIQVKSSSKPMNEKKRKTQRYRFSFRKSVAQVYDKDSVQIFCMVALDRDLICFVLNDGKKVHYNINADDFTQELENQSFDAVMRGIV